MDPHALQVLEFDAMRALLAANAETALGATLAETLEPSASADDVWEGLAKTEEAHRLLASAPPPSLGPVRDLRNPLKRASKAGVLGGAELFQIADAMRAMREVRNVLSTRAETEPRLWVDAASLPDLRRLEGDLFDSLEPNGDVKDGASTHLASLRQTKARTQARLQEKVQSYTSGKTRELLSDPIVTVRDGRYVVPLKSEYRGRIKGIVHDTSASGQTLYVEPEDVLQLGNLVREAEAAEREEIQRILVALSGKVGESAHIVSVGIEAAARLDLALAKARLAYDLKGTLPERLKSARIEVEAGRHPLLDPKSVVPLDIAVGVGSSVLITGPNTGGKTVAIKATGLFVLMAQSGLFPPARRIRLGHFSQVWADIGDEQSVQQSLSTFSGHLKNIAHALKWLQEGALVLLDELGAGTDPAEGAALAKAILSEIAANGGAVLASTHYGELKAYAFETDGFQNAAMEFDGKTLRPTYRLTLGAAGASQGLTIAERYGIPKAVVARAREGLSSQHLDMSKAMDSLDEARKLARNAQGEADRRLAELRKAEQKAEKKLQEADEIRRKVHAEATATIEDALRAMRDEAAQIFEDLKQAGSDGKAMSEARSKLKGLQARGSDLAQSFKPVERTTETPTGLAKGMTVRADGYAQTGVVLDDPQGKQVAVQMGAIKMNLPLSILHPVAAKPSAQRSRTNIRLQKAQTVMSELHLRALRAEEAERELERFLDDAMLAGVPSVRIVHGKGEGILRNVTRDYLKRSPNVGSFRDGEPAEGGQGVTIVVFK